MRRLGNKNEARKLAKKAKVPVVPGSEGLVTDEDQALGVAHEMGYPVLIKAAAGGGGRGMRVARNDVSLQAGLKAAQPGSRERLQGRQRLHRKIHRTAAPRRSADPRRPPRQRRPSLGARLLAAAPASEARRGIARPEPADRRCARRSARRPCGSSRRRATTTPAPASSSSTRTTSFYFIEVNARIQVEHPVTELVTGIDLVREQIRIAAGEKLRFKQKDIVQRGHAIECRINAEDPANNFRAIARHDHALAAARRSRRPPRHARLPGYRVPPNYDSMVAKLLVHQPTRAEAIACMRRALGEFVVEGIKTTIPIHREILQHTAFIEGQRRYDVHRTHVDARQELKSRCSTRREHLEFVKTPSFLAFFRAGGQMPEGGGRRRACSARNICMQC